MNSITTQLLTRYTGNNPIKGPGSRIDLDVRRIWNCPQCGSRAKTVGTIVSRRCFCLKDGTWMTLLEEPPPKKEYQPRPSDDIAEQQSEPAKDPVDVSAEPTVAESPVAETDFVQPDVPYSAPDPPIENKEVSTEQAESSSGEQSESEQPKSTPDGPSE